MRVTILMATYNGAAFIEQQINSILEQSYQDWELIIRDDRSTDRTVEIIKTYVKKDRRIKLLELPGKHGSAVLNFSALFAYAVKIDAAYVMFSDQDDIWKANKVESSLRFIQEQESVLNNLTPLLVYSSLQYVDVHGHRISRKLHMPSYLDMRMLLCENHAYGCTMILNNALLKQTGDIPHLAENHDYWIALVACAFGKAVHNPEQLLFYRQHSHNVSGNVGRSKLNSRLFRYVRRVNHMLPVFVKNLRMIKGFYIRYSASFEPEVGALISGYLRAFEKTSFRLFLFMSWNRLRKLKVLQSLTHYYIVARLREETLLHLAPQFARSDGHVEMEKKS